MQEIMRGDATQAQIAGFLVALRAKGETADEIAGCAEAMREHVLPVQPKRADLVDTAGTGGDGKHTLNISTAAALVAAAAGAGVAKHGNRAASSQTGSADVLEALGFELELAPERIARSIDELGFGFMFAQAHHPAMRHAAPVRRELGTRTVFNVLGPLTNPARARAQVVGVYSPRSCARSRRRSCSSARAAPSSCTAPAASTSSRRRPEPRLRGGRRRRPRARRSTPAELGIERCDLEELARRRAGRERDGDPRASSRASRAAARDAILLNAAGAIAAGGHADDLREGIELAREAIDSGAAAARLDELIAFSQRRAGMRFADALAQPGLRAIAEVKRRSPSAGDLRPDADPAQLAAQFANAGAAAISVLVDERFAGTIDDLRAARAATDAPLLGKGFFSGEEHLRELRDAGADAVLLILRDLDDATAAAARVRARARHRRARRGARRRRAAARDRARRAGDRRQRARPLDVRDRPRRAARARRPRAAATAS